MKGKIIGFSLLICLVVAMFALPGNTYAATKFSDVSGHWAEKYINEAVAQGIVKGYPDGKFLPDNPVTRAEFATIVNKALGNTGTTTINFKDVPRVEWYYNEIAKAVAATYVAGYDDNTYKPNNSITRQEAAVMISRFVPTYGHSGRITSFNDYRNIDEWAYAALQKVNGKGYIGGYTDGGIHPQDKLTRAQAAKIICDILDEETIVKTTTTVKNDGTKLSGKIYSNNVVMHKDLDDDSATIDNAIILGTLTIEGGGTETITVNNSRVSNVVVDKDDSAVRVLAKGETAISTLTASEESILQTDRLAGGFYGSGFNNIILKSSAESTLKGSFPLVSLDGASATLNLESGTISELKVTSSGRKSTITASSGTTISNATVGGESYFRGTGTISHMAVNSNGVTYETKPKNWTIASKIETPSQVDPALDITFSPKQGATKVNINTNITLTFSSAVKMYDGSTIKNDDIPDFITLRKKSSSGTSVDFTAKIDSAKKVITITPSDNLDEDTRYYVILDKNSLKDAKGKGNASQSMYFTTGDSDAGITFSPKNGATIVDLRPTITIKFSDKVVQDRSGSVAVDNTYAKGSVTLKQGSRSIAFTATINSAKNTITIKPSEDLKLGEKCTVAVIAKKLKTSGGTTIPASSVTYNVGHSEPELKNLAVTAGDYFLDVEVTPNVAGTVHVIALEAGSAEPSPTQVANGKNKTNGAAISYKKETAKVGSATKIKLTDGLDPGTKYDIYVTLESTATKSYSKVVNKKGVETTLVKAKLTNITISPGAIPFKKDDYEYSITVPSDVEEIEITALAEEEGSIITIDGTEGSSGIVNLKDVSKTKTVKVVASKANRSETTYTLHFNVVRNTNITLKIGGAVKTGAVSDDGKSVTYTYRYTTPGSLNVSIVTEDSKATVGEFSGLTPSNESKDFSVTLDEITSVLAFKVFSGNAKQSHVITFVKE